MLNQELLNHPKKPNHQCGELVALFNDTFADEYDTVLSGGADEPLYSPATSDKPAMICFREDYFSSALHEIAHWCIAGAERRKQTDYGYWYTADGRDHEQQQAFFSAEVKPQSMEWLLSHACDYPFQVSVDNVAAQERADWTYWEQLTQQKQQFRQQCFDQIVDWYATSLPSRGTKFMNVLARYYQRGWLCHSTDVEQLGLKR